MRYTQEQLQRAFDAVANPQDWKAPIEAVIESSAWQLTKAAIVHFTATQPTLKANDDGRFVVTAPGYRAGPAW